MLQELVETVHPEALLFDLDGVLWSSSTLHDTAYRQMGQLAGIDVPPYETLAGRATRDVVKELGQAFGKSDNQIEEMIRVKQRLFLELAGASEPWCADINELSTLALVVDCAIVTGASPQTVERYLDLNGNNVDWKLTVDSSWSLEGKPSPDPYLVACNRLGRDPRRSLVFEDSIQGLRSANSAGCMVVHVFGELGETCPIDHDSDGLQVATCIASIEKAP